MIGVDEISYRRGQRYLTQVCDHATAAIVWARPDRDAATLQAFFNQLGEHGRASIRAISIDMNGGYEKAIREQIAADEHFDPELCFDPFVRHEALPVRAGCKTLPPGCRGSP